MNRNLTIGALVLTVAVAAVAFTYSHNTSPSDLSASAAQAGMPDAGETLIFHGAQEDLANVAFTLKRSGNSILVYQGRPRGGAKPVFTLRSSLAGKQIYRGGSTAKKNLVYAVVQDLVRKQQDPAMSYLLEPTAGRNAVAASFTVDNTRQRICRGYGCDDNIALSWAGSPDRLWLYEGSQASGIENARFTVRGDLTGALPLIPVLADLD